MGGILDDRDPGIAGKPEDLPIDGCPTEVDQDQGLDPAVDRSLRRAVTG
ncbi:MAG: hypothetical protein R2701_03475 [Acidimicrobiales bacterium]